MKVINAITLLFLVGVMLLSCNRFTSPPTVSPTEMMETALSIAKTGIAMTQTALPTSTVTATATETVTATSTSVPPTLRPTLSTTKATSTPSSLVHSIFITAVDETGEIIYAYPPNPFWIFMAEPDEIALINFDISLNWDPSNKSNDDGQLLIYRYNTGGTYTNQTVIEKKTIKSSNYRSSADIKMKELQEKFGDCSAFTFQVVDGKRKVQNQGYISLNADYLIIHYGMEGIKGDLTGGVTIGDPYSLNEPETEFFHEGKFVTIHEPQSGFYWLYYWFDLYTAADLKNKMANMPNASATDELEKIAKGLSLRVFPYRDDGNYSILDSQSTTGKLRGPGYFRVDLPIDYLLKNPHGSNKYYLQIMDETGKIIKEEYFMFIPYAQ